MNTYYAQKYARLILDNILTIEDVPLVYREMTQQFLSDSGFIDKLNIVDSVEQAMNLKWEDIKVIRDKKETSGCPYKGSVLDSDIRSVIKINTAIAAATKYGNQFVINWTMQDNSIKTLTYYDLMEIPLVLAQFSNSLHEKARGYRNILNQILERFNNGQISKSEAITEIKAVNWQD